jgi:tetratricopeptide (TPR) repeat protein
VSQHAALALIYYMKGDSRAALERYRRAQELESGPGWLHWNMAVAYLAAGSPAQALEELDKVPRATAETATDLNATRANVYALAGRTEEARRLLVEKGGEAAAGPVEGIEQAAARFALGDDGIAYEWLERAIANHEHAVQYLAVEPRFARVRNDPRFKALLKQVGLDQ